MQQVAVFVDAGYLFAQGSALLAGEKQPRRRTDIRVPAVLEALQKLAAESSQTARLLRIYWYDGAVQGRLSSVQEQIAMSPGCKLRLGLINSAGQQKGVDSLIVTDLIELARNRAISNALLLAGDEDLRIGVQIAQSFGVQVHLLGIQPARGSQSIELIREADSHHEWTRDDVSAFLSIAPDTPAGTALRSEEEGGLEPSSSDPEELLEQAVETCLEALGTIPCNQVVAAYRANPASVPPELDRRMLPVAARLLGESALSEDRKRRLRVIAKDKLRALADASR